MKYKVGDKLIYNWYGSMYESCTVVKVLENTNRYRVSYISNWMGKDSTQEKIMSESELFLNKEDAINSEINLINNQINLLQSKIEKLNNIKDDKT